MVPTHKNYTMRKVEKFATFEDLKASQSKASKHSSSLRKHASFENVVKEIVSSKHKKPGKK